MYDLCIYDLCISRKNGKTVSSMSRANLLLKLLAIPLQVYIQNIITSPIIFVQNTKIIVLILQIVLFIMKVDNLHNL